MQVLIEAAGLAEQMRKPGLRVLDVRWRLDAPDGRPAYRAGHLPGAVYVDVGAELAAPPSAAGRHPLPEPGALQGAARRWRLRNGDLVVAYDDLGGMSAARAWWLLTDAGLDVRLLDGGLAAWRGAGLPLETGQAQPQAGDVVLRPGRLPAIDLDGADAWPGAGVLLDARAGERYRGEVEPVDPVAGHIPGAISAPTTETLGPDGRFLDAAALRARLAALGAEPSAQVAAYCGSGVTAAHTIAALAIAGIDAALYPGSWSEWSRRPGAPVAVGP